MVLLPCGDDRSKVHARTPTIQFAIVTSDQWFREPQHQSVRSTGIHWEIGRIKKARQLQPVQSGESLEPVALQSLQPLNLDGATAVKARGPALPATS
jgi:hypothetical protein